MAKDLSTTVNVEMESERLDSTISFCESNPIFSEIGELLSNLKQDVNQACVDGAKEIAEDNKSLQELMIQTNGSIITGGLINSIKLTQNNDMSWTILPEADYAEYVEYGRGEVRPSSAKALHFFDHGVEVFTKYSGPATPKPFVEPAFTGGTLERGLSILEGCINNVIN